MKYANQVLLFFLWISVYFISCQQTENSTAENLRTSLSSIPEDEIEQNVTNMGAEKNQSFLLIKEFKNETKELDIVPKSKLVLNSTEISVEKNQSVIPTKVITNETKLVSLNNSLTLGSLIRPMNVIIKSSSMATSDINYTLESSPSKNVEFRDTSEMVKGDQHAVSSKLMQEIQLLKSNHNLSTSANNLFKLVVPYMHQENPHLIGVWKVPHEVLRTNNEGRDIRPASVIESRSFITNPEISSVRLNLAFPETLNNARIESRTPMGYDDGPDYDSGEPYSSNESGEPPESGVYTETSLDSGRFLEDDYRKEIEKEAEAFIKKQKAQNATNNDKAYSAEMENPGSMENNYPTSIETEKGPQQTETDSQEGHFTSQEGKGPIETDSQQGYFTSHNGNKVFFYKGNDNFFNIDDVFPLLKFDQMYNQPLIDDYPEGFYVPSDHDKTYPQMGHSEYPPQFSHTTDTHALDNDNLHTNNDVPDIHSKYHSPMEDSPCTREQEDIEQAPESDPGNVNQDYHNSEPNYDTNHHHSGDFDEDIPPEYQDNDNYKHRYEPHVIGGPPEYEDREKDKVHPQANGNHERNLQHNSNIAQGQLEYHRKKSQMHQYEMQQKYEIEHHQEKSRLRKVVPKTPYHFHIGTIRNKPEQIQSFENHNDIPHDPKENTPFLNHNKPVQIQNHKFMPHHNSNLIIHNHNTNSHSFQHHNQNIDSLSHGQNIVPNNRNKIFHTPHNQNQQFVPTSHENSIPPHVQHPNFHLPHHGKQNFIPPQVQNPDVQSKVNFQSSPTALKVKPDCQETELLSRDQNNHNSPPSYHYQKHLETPQSLAVAIARSTNLAMGKRAGNHNIRYPISTLVALASSERKIEEIHPKEKGKRSKQKSHIKRSKARTRNGKNRSKEQHKKQRKARRSTRDNMKAEAATYHWGLENHKDKDGFFMYANNPFKDDYEYGYRVGGPQQTLERHHKTEGVTSTTKLNWEDQNGDSGDQYWEFNHASSEEERAAEPSSTAKIPQKI